MILGRPALEDLPQPRAIAGDDLLEGPAARFGGGEPAAALARQQAPVQQADGDRLQRAVDAAARQSTDLPAELRQQPHLVGRERNAAPFGNAAISLPAMLAQAEARDDQLQLLERCRVVRHREALADRLGSLAARTRMPRSPRPRGTPDAAPR
jgi:hypothetical protein